MESIGPAQAMKFDSAVRIPACEKGRASRPSDRSRNGMAKAGPDPNPVLDRACDADLQTGKLQSGFLSRKATVRPDQSCPSARSASGRVARGSPLPLRRREPGAAEIAGPCARWQTSYGPAKVTKVSVRMAVEVKIFFLESGRRNRETNLA